MSLLQKFKEKVTADQMTFGSVALVVAIGNTLTGWGTVSWVLWIPPFALGFAAISGICPFKIVFEKLGFAKKHQTGSCG